MWYENSPDGEMSLKTSRFASGMMVDGPTEVAKIDGLLSGGKLVAVGANYFLAWGQYNVEVGRPSGLFGVHLDNRGRPTSPQRRILEEGPAEFSLASNGQSALIVWKREHWGSSGERTSELLASIIRESDSTLAIVRVTSRSTRWRVPRDLTSVGDDYLLGFSSNQMFGGGIGTLEILRLTWNGYPRGIPATITSQDQGPGPFLASDGVNSALALYRRRVNGPPFFGVSRVIARLVMLDTLVSRSRGAKR